MKKSKKKSGLINFLKKYKYGAVLGGVWWGILHSIAFALGPTLDIELWITPGNPKYPFWRLLVEEPITEILALPLNIGCFISPIGSLIFIVLIGATIGYIIDKVRK